MPRATNETILRENTESNTLEITNSRESEEIKYEYRTWYGLEESGVQDEGSRDSPVTYDKQKKRTAI